MGTAAAVSIRGFRASIANIRRLEPTLTRSVARMLARMTYVVQFLMAAAIGLVFVFIADLQDEFGLSGTQAGIVAATGFGAALVGQLLLSPFIDRGHAAPVAWVAVVMGVGGSIGFGLGSNVWHFAIGRGMTGMGLGLFGIVARKALLGLDAAGGGAKLGALLSSAVAGFIMGPVIGAVLGEISFATPFIAVGLATAIPGAIAAKQISETEIATAKVDYSDLGELLKRPRIQAAMLTQFVVFGFIGIFDGTVDRYLTDIGFGTLAIAICLLVLGAPMLVLPAKAGAFAERVGGARVVVPGIAVSLPVMVLFGFVGGALSFALVGLVYGITESFTNMGAQVLVLEATGAERAAVGSAVLDAVGMAVAAVTAGFGLAFYEAFGEVALFGGWAAIGVACLALMTLRLKAVRLPPEIARV